MTTNRFKLFLYFSLLCISAQTLESKDTGMNQQKSSGQIKLFVYNSCPWCKKVIDYLKQIGHLDKITILDASNKNNMTELMELSGSTQCPYLSDEINGVAMPESADIIKYFSTRF